MAALDPSMPPTSEDADAVPRATLKLIREHIDLDDEDDEDDEDEDEDDIEAIERRLAGALSDDDEDEDDDEDKRGGPSDPARLRKAKKVAALKALLEGFADEDEEEDDEDEPNGVNGVKKNKGKAKISGDIEDIDMDELDDDEDIEFEEFVVCTLDPTKVRFCPSGTSYSILQIRQFFFLFFLFFSFDFQLTLDCLQHYQQTLDITVGEDERVYFQVIGTHDIYLTGNYIIPPQGFDDDEDEDDYDDDDYDLPPYDDEELSDDELDNLPDPRVEEVDSEEEAPKLVKAKKADKEKTKASKKRAAEDDEEAETLDSLIQKTLNEENAANGEQKLSKKQLKKLKNNQGQAVPAATDAKAGAESKESNGSAKKVQFAKNLEQGPTPSPASKEKGESKKTGLGVKVIKGVTIDDKKLGTGRAAKPGDKIGMRYIGKLDSDGKIFDGT